MCVCVRVMVGTHSNRSDLLYFTAVPSVWSNGTCWEIVGCYVVHHTQLLVIPFLIFRTKTCNVTFYFILFSCRDESGKARSLDFLCRTYPTPLCQGVRDAHMEIFMVRVGQIGTIRSAVVVVSQRVQLVLDVLFLLLERALTAVDLVDVPYVNK